MYNETIHSTLLKCTFLCHFLNKKKLFPCASTACACLSYRFSLFFSIKCEFLEHRTISFSSVVYNKSSEVHSFMQSSYTTFVSARIVKQMFTNQHSSCYSIISDEKQQILPGCETIRSCVDFLSRRKASSLAFIAGKLVFFLPLFLSFYTKPTEE